MNLRRLLWKKLKLPRQSHGRVPHHGELSQNAEKNRDIFYNFLSEFEFPGRFVAYESAQRLAEVFDDLEIAEIKEVMLIRNDESGYLIQFVDNSDNSYSARINSWSGSFTRIYKVGEEEPIYRIR